MAGENENLREQIIKHIESNFPEDKKTAAISQIENMSEEELENFIEKNNASMQGQGKCIFCSIISGEIPSYKIDENKSSLAVLEINPVSNGHVLIIPKKHGGGISKAVISFSSKISKKIKERFSPKSILNPKSNMFGHEIMNIIPVYKNETPNSERYKAEKEELEKVQKILTQKKEKTEKKPKAQRIHEGEKLWLPRRFP